MKKILIVEDEVTIRAILIEMLEEAGYQAIAAPDGHTGIHLAQLHHPDLILCDILMPEPDGYTVLMTLRQHPATARLPFIFLTAMTDRADIRRGMISGADDYLIKPFTQEELLRSVETRLQRQTQTAPAQPSGGSLELSAGDRELAADLRQSLLNSELCLYYQSRIATCSGRIIGCEALIRWQHPRWGTIEPMHLITLAETTGLIFALDDWVLKIACRQMQRWQQRTGNPALQLSVNLSGYQFTRPNLCQWITQILKQTQLAPQSLELELTETTVVSNVEQAVLWFGELKALGIKIAIDDFGTGYASLGRLQAFPFDTLKIDRRFIQDLGNNPKNAAIVKAVIQMAHALKLNVVAEGVELAVERQFLWQHQCDQMQGYLFSSPLPALEFEQLLLADL